MAMCTVRAAITTDTQDCDPARAGQAQSAPWRGHKKRPGFHRAFSFPISCLSGSDHSTQLGCGDLRLTKDGVQIVGINLSVDFFERLGKAGQSFGCSIGEELGNYPAVEQLTQQCPVTFVEAGVFKQISHGAEDGR